MEKICVVGLGYVGLPLAVTFAENSYNVIGFDLNKNKIEKYLSGQDPTNEVGDERTSISIDSILSEFQEYSSDNQIDTEIGRYLYTMKKK